MDDSPPIVRPRRRLRPHREPAEITEATAAAPTAEAPPSRVDGASEPSTEDAVQPREDVAAKEVTLPDPPAPRRLRRLKRLVEEPEDQPQPEEARVEDEEPPPEPQQLESEEELPSRRRTGALRAQARRARSPGSADEAPPEPTETAEELPVRRRSARLRLRPQAQRDPSPESEDEDMPEPMESTKEPIVRRRSARLRARAARARGEEPEKEILEELPEERAPEREELREVAEERAPERQRQSIYDSEESDDDAANELAQALRHSQGSAGQGSTRVLRTVGSDADPEVSAWREDLAARWSNSSQQRPSAAFSSALLDRGRIRSLPQACRLAGYPVFDAAGKVNLPLLLGAHKQLLAQGASSRESRQVGWLARQALALDLIDASQLKTGRLMVLTKGPARKKAKMTTLVPLEEVKWPSQKKKVSKRKAEGALFSEEEESEDEEIKRAMAQEALLNQLREAVKKSEARRQHLSAAAVDVKAVKEAALAPRLSFDLYGPEDESPDADTLEVLPPEGVYRGTLLRDQVQRQLFAAAAKGLVTEEAKKDLPATRVPSEEAAAELAAAAAGSGGIRSGPTLLESAPEASSEDKAPCEDAVEASTTPGNDSQSPHEDSQGSSLFRPDSEESEGPDEDADSLSTGTPSEELEIDVHDVHAYRRSRQQVAKKDARQYRKEWEHRLREAKTLGPLGKEFLGTILSKEDFIRFKKTTKKARPPCDGKKLPTEKAVLWLRGDEDDFQDAFRGLRPKQPKKPGFLANFKLPAAN